MDDYVDTASSPAQTSFEEDEALLKQKDSLHGNNLNSTNNSCANFECSICLDQVRDPVVTICGHLYCWPCMYKWIITSRSNDPVHRNSRCPVCKKRVSEETLIPLYIPGGASDDKGPQRPAENGASGPDFLIPRRPTRSESSSILRGAIGSYSGPFRAYYGGGGGGGSSYVGSCPIHQGSSSSSRLIDSVVGMFGDSEDTMSYYSLVDNISPRMRRRLKEAEESLGRVCFFLFCCALMCLLLF